MKSLNKVKGNRGETLALNYLIKEKGFQLVEQNYHYGKGEIDIVMRDGNYLVFVEVKSRDNDLYGAPEYAITRQKVLQLQKLGQSYLFEKGITDTLCRFDVVTLLFDRTGKPEINHYENAF